MGKRTHRWVVPHAEPAKQSPSKGMGSDQRCVWPECDGYVDARWNIHLCYEHVNHVRNVFDDYERETKERDNKYIAEREAVISENTRKINAGEKVDATRRDLVPGWVYYALIDGLIKIGFAKSVQARMRQYPPTAKLLAVEPGTLQTERSRHQYFGKHLAKGREWFTDTPELRAWIDTVIAEYGTADDLKHRWGREEKRPVVAGKRQRRG